MKSRVWLVAAASLALCAATIYAADKIKLEGIKCPVSGKAAKDGTEVDYKGGKVFFCCEGCPKGFADNTAKFATKANHQLVATGQAKQIKCPLTGRDLNPDTAIKAGGASVVFCCNNCKGKAEKLAGDEQLTALFGDKAFEKAFKVGEEKKEDKQ